MTNQSTSRVTSESITSPDADHPGEATSPPGNPDTDEQAVEESQREARPGRRRPLSRRRRRGRLERGLRSTSLAAEPYPPLDAFVLAARRPSSARSTGAAAGDRLDQLGREVAACLSDAPRAPHREAAACRLVLSERHGFTGDQPTTAIRATRCSTWCSSAARAADHAVGPLGRGRAARRGRARRRRAAGPLRGRPLRRRPAAAGRPVQRRRDRPERDPARARAARGAARDRGPDAQQPGALLLGARRPVPRAARRGAAALPLTAREEHEEYARGSGRELSGGRCRPR